MKRKNIFLEHQKIKLNKKIIDYGLQTLEGKFNLLENEYVNQKLIFYNFNVKIKNIFIKSVVVYDKTRKLLTGN